MKILVETGTHIGLMVDSMKSRFEQVHSIELGQDLYEHNVMNFKEDSNVYLYQGDSGEVLPTFIPYIEEPILFWLDAHYSGGITAKGPKITPIVKELECILQREHHDVLLIDDFHSFGATWSFPTFDDLSKMVLEKKPNMNITVEEDIIRVVPEELDSQLAPA